jgi:hypothetical protein
MVSYFIIGLYLLCIPKQYALTQQQPQPQPKKMEQTPSSLHSKHESFYNYETEYYEVSALVNKLFGEWTNRYLLDNQKNKDNISSDSSLHLKIKRQLDALNGLVLQMETELLNMVNSNKYYDNQNYLNDLRNRLDACRRDCRQKKMEYQNIQQDMLLYTPKRRSSQSYLSDEEEDDLSDDNPIMNQYETRRLLERSSRSIEESLRTANEIEQSGTFILEQLADQRGVIERARSKLRTVDDEIYDSRRIISRMEWRALFQRCILITAIIVLVIVILLYVLYSLKKSFI